MSSCQVCRGSNVTYLVSWIAERCITGKCGTVCWFLMRRKKKNLFWLLKRNYIYLWNIFSIVVIVDFKGFNVTAAVMLGTKEYKLNCLKCKHNTNSFNIFSHDHCPQTWWRSSTHRLNRNCWQPLLNGREREGLQPPWESASCQGPSAASPLQEGDNPEPVSQPACPT